MGGGGGGAGISAAGTIHAKPKLNREQKKLF
jgi:hypothetical protein